MGITSFITFLGQNLVYLAIVLVISSLPLYFAVKFMGGRSSIIRVIFVNFVMAAIFVYLGIYLNAYLGIAAFLSTLLVYKIIFRLSLFRSFLAWVLQYIIAIGLFALILVITTLV